MVRRLLKSRVLTNPFMIKGKNRELRNRCKLTQKLLLVKDRALVLKKTNLLLSEARALVLLLVKLEGRGDAPHQPPWGLKQKDTFLEFTSCRDWLLNSIPPGEVNRQRERNHSTLYHAYVEKYHERLLKHVKNFKKSKSSFDEEKAKFETDKKAEEWGREGLKGKLRAADELLAKERADWKAICAKDNERMYAAHAKITDLEGQVVELKKKKMEDAQATKEQVEVELKATISSRDKDLIAKDVEIAELKRHLQEQVDKSESLEIDLEAKKGNAASAEEGRQKAEEARNVSTAALNVAQNNYSEVQGIVDTLATDAEWMRGRGVCLVFGQAFDTSHCSVTDKADAELARAEKAYDHLSLPVMDLVMDTLNHDDWCQRLKFLLNPPETVELSDEEEPEGDDEGGDNDGDGKGGDDGYGDRLE
ncbi:hypothetical protein Hanom_Chr07g00598451 [Helianthus anomalus]